MGRKVLKTALLQWFLRKLSGLWQAGTFYLAIRCNCRHIPRLGNCRCIQHVAILDLRACKWMDVALPIRVSSTLFMYFRFPLFTVEEGVLVVMSADKREKTEEVEGVAIHRIPFR